MGDGSKDLLRFPAAGDWRCSFLAWLPRGVDLDEERLVRVARRGVMRIHEGALRRRALALLDAGEIEIEDLAPRRVAELAARMRILVPHGPWPLESDGRVLEIAATAPLDAGTSSLWIALAVACSVAAAGHGTVLDPACFRELAPGMLTARLPARPRVALAEHLLVMSSSDAAGTGRMTTLGLARLGMPELKIEDVPETALIGLASIVNAVACHLHERVTTSRIDKGRRDVAMPAEILVQLAWREAAFGRPARNVPWFEEGEDAPPKVRLELAFDDEGEPWIELGPPRDWRGGRTAWARALVKRSGLTLAPPLPPSCGHDGPRGGEWDA